jgi:hypothetical protein
LAILLPAICGGARGDASLSAILADTLIRAPPGPATENTPGRRQSTAISAMEARQDFRQDSGESGGCDVRLACRNVSAYAVYAF